MFKEIVLAVASIFGLVDDTPKIEGQPVNEWIEEIPYNDEYDFFQFEITNVNEDSIYGNSKSDKIEDYNGLYLEKGYVDSKEIELKKGDEILVIFEKDCHDCIVDIKKMD